MLNVTHMVDVVILPSGDNSVRFIGRFRRSIITCLDEFFE